ncbi:MAG TPA: hypothetical protein VNR70_15885 [Steroidobacteraceae bacterium]|nr:hypothetical protein [Steroidobacteraceae bacterium]
MEHRWGRRQSTDVTVSFVAMPATMGVGRVLNVSMTGAFMATTAPLRLMSLVYLTPTVRPLVNGVIRRLGACIVRRDALGVGLEWCESAVEAYNLFAGFTPSYSERIDAESPIYALTSVRGLPRNREESPQTIVQ